MTPAPQFNYRHLRNENYHKNTERLKGAEYPCIICGRPGNIGPLWDEDGKVIGHAYRPRVCNKRVWATGSLSRLEYSPGPVEWKAEPFVLSFKSKERRK